MLRATLVVLLALALGACVQEDQDAGPAPTRPAPTATSADPSPPPVAFDRYVALGDSFAAGPGIPTVTPESGFCLRSTASYPALLATQVAAGQVVDVSCSGADTAAVTTGRNGGILGAAQAPQLDAVTVDTDLVTVTIGGNNGVLQALLAACLRGTEATCSTFADRDAPDVVTAAGTAVADVLRAVAERAPDARVVLVGYLTLTAESGTCDALGLAAGSVPSVHRAEVALDTALAGAARTADVDYVSMLGPSAGHDVCSDAPWVNGVQGVTGQDGIVLHPNAAGMKAVAAEVAAALG